MIIYAHINKINGKSYIGQTYSTKNRWSGNGEQYRGCTKFYNAIKKYGWDNFQHIILEYTTPELADKREQYYIKKFNSIENGYNLTTGGNSGRRLSPEARQAKKDWYKTHKNPNLGTKRTLEQCLMQSIRQREYYKTHVSKLKGRCGELSSSWGRKHSEETKRKMSEKAKGKKNSMYGVPSPFKGKHFSEEQKKRLSNIKSRPVIATNEKTGELLEFKSSIYAGNYINKSRSSIYVYIKDNKKSHQGFYWSYKL